jgi:hypothetical protein
MWSLLDIIAMNDQGKLGEKWWNNLKNNFSISFGKCAEEFENRHCSAQPFQKKLNKCCSFRKKSFGARQCLSNSANLRIQ